MAFQPTAAPTARPTGAPTTAPNRGAASASGPEIVAASTVVASAVPTTLPAIPITPLLTAFFQVGAENGSLAVKLSMGSADNVTDGASLLLATLTSCLDAWV